MVCNLTIVRYAKWLSWAGFLSMAVFHFPLWLDKRIHFYKLMGCGKNGSFDIIPDIQQWALLTVSTGSTEEKIQLNFINFWWKLFHCEVYTLVLEPIEGHGSWDGKKCFGQLPKQTDHDGLIAVITRATIKLNRLRNFWQHVAAVSTDLNKTEGLISSVGIGEIPFIKQATFSIWENKHSLKQFAYKRKEHTQVIKLTHEQQWYSEEMFVRFKIHASFGTLKQIDPLKGKL